MNGNLSNDYKNSTKLNILIGILSAQIIGFLVFLFVVQTLVDQNETAMEITHSDLINNESYRNKMITEEISNLQTEMKNIHHDLKLKKE